MKIAFFAARRIQRQYFSALAQQINKQQESCATVIWHKSQWLHPGWLLHLRKRSDQQSLTDAVTDHLREKQNSAEGRTRPASYWRRFRLLKSAEARLLSAIYQQALAASGASAVVVWNGLKFRQRIVVAAAQALGIHVLYMENGLLPGMTTLDSQGINFRNSVPRDPAFFIAQSGTVPMPPPVRPAKPEGLPEHYIFVPFQVNTDSQVVLFSPWLKDMYALTDALLLAEQHLGEAMPQMVLKTHPACDQDYTLLAQQLEQQSQRIRLLLSGDTQAMIAYADAVATINSTVGIEAIIANIRTLVLGQAFYNLPGLTLSAHNQQMLEQALTALPEFRPNPTIRQGFLHYLAHSYQLPGRWQDAGDTHLNAAAERILHEVRGLG